MPLTSWRCLVVLLLFVLVHSLPPVIKIVELEPNYRVPINLHRSVVRSMMNDSFHSPTHATSIKVDLIYRYNFLHQQCM
ncbi:hypothetical protein J6590_032711 [Homalodisca vitripennis]|nr:hypothetical protein J6590_032711 [Homalodisca vitripennis]